MYAGPTPDEPIRVVLVDDQALLRDRTQAALWAREHGLGSEQVSHQTLLTGVGLVGPLELGP